MASEHTAEIGGQLVFWRSAQGGEPPVLYVHGVPTSGADWLPFLDRTGGLAPDLPGFGRSGKRGDGDYTMAGYDRFLEAFLDHLEVERVRLVVHDWGGVGLLWAQRFPDRLERLVIIDTVPLMAGYRWHRIARAWRTRGLGELVMGATSRWSLKQLSREATPRKGPLPDEFLDRAIEHFDQGTQRAILRLYRSAPEEELARAGARLGTITAPALIVWGERDPYVSPRFAEGYAALLGGEAEVLRLPDAGHWPWLDRPDVVDRVAAFLEGRFTGPNAART
jgi:pimeloyl-ACP methyl ester carboxylesterase